MLTDNYASNTILIILICVALVLKIINSFLSSYTPKNHRCRSYVDSDETDYLDHMAMNGYMNVDNECDDIDETFDDDDELSYILEGVGLDIMDIENMSNDECCDLFESYDLDFNDYDI